ncbi:MAG TPA: type II toxin-antitoxin system HicA family toxin [Chloroflexota bacterium]
MIIQCAVCSVKKWDGMPRKLRPRKADLRQAGAHVVRQRGSHTSWQHPDVPGILIELSGHDGDDAHAYQERDVRDALRRIAGTRGEDKA